MQHKFFNYSLFILSCLLTNVALSQDLSDGLLLHYEFDGNAMDASVNENDGTPSGVVYVEDRNGNPDAACYFDGVDDFIDLPNIPALKPDLPVTIAFWVKFDTYYYEQTSIFNTSFEDDYSAGIAFTTSALDNRIAIGYGDGSPGYMASNRRTYISNSAIDTSDWHHITLVFNGALDMKVYLDCQENGGDYAGSGGALSYSLNPGSIGRHDRNTGDPGDYFKGKLDDFRYWNRALTIEEIEMICSDPEVNTIPEMVESEPKVNIYPNPSSGLVNIEVGDDSNPSRIIVRNISGQIVHSTPFSKSIDLAYLSRGSYILNIQYEEGTIRKKLIIH